MVGDLRPLGQRAQPREAPADHAEVERGDRQAAERTG
jgi:hypothetical protein